MAQDFQKRPASTQVDQPDADTGDKVDVKSKRTRSKTTKSKAVQTNGDAAPAQEGIKAALDELSAEDRQAVLSDLVQTLLSTDAKKSVVAEAAQTLPLQEQKDVATTTANALPAEEKKDLATSLVPDKPVVNRVWLTGVYSFAAVFVLSAVGVIVTPFFGASEAAVGNMLQVLMLSGGFLSGLIAGRALVGDVMSRVGR